jgi:pantoate--beta-alanine ligase
MNTGSPLDTVHSIAGLRSRVGDWRQQGLSVGLVPTMGALHEGHLTLVRHALARCDRVVATIFVNPTQFGPNEDFSRYPRDEAADATKLTAAGCSLLFVPTVDEMYRPGFSTSISVGPITEGLCGRFRPGHFTGVATVVAKLLNQARPDIAFFGEKDYQQLQVIRRMAGDLDIPVRIEGVPTVREADGLAMSSRNLYLSDAERVVAAGLYRVLTGIAARIGSGAETIETALAQGKSALLEAGFSRIDYLEICDAETLEPLASPDRPGRIVAAAWLGRTRLIDNIPLYSHA